MQMKRQLKTYAALFITLFLVTAVSCGNQNKTTGGEQEQAAPQNSLEISLSSFNEKIHSDPALKVLDVRTPQEFEEFHVKGAVLLPLQDIMSGGEGITSRIPFQKSDEIYVICRSGNRSFTATRILRSLGYEKAVSVQGGTAGFMNQGNECGSATLVCAQ